MESDIRARILGEAPMPALPAIPSQRTAVAKTPPAKVMLGHKDGKIVMGFPIPMRMISLSESEARDIARTLRSLADKVRVPDREKRHRRKRQTN